MAGCAGQHKRQTREEWLNTTTRYYTNVSKDDVFSASEKLFTLSDGDDYVFSHTEDSLNATRKWSVYMVLAAAIGTDYWRVTAKETDKGIKTTVQASTQAQAITPMPTSNGDFYAATSPLAGTPIVGTALYDVFWARMDYLLGKKSDWMTCDEADKRIKDGITWGNNEPLCNVFNVKDADPTGKTKQDKQKNTLPD